MRNITLKKISFYYILPAILFFLTVITTLFFGTLLEGAVPELSIGILIGFPFSIAVIVVVGAHGLGHYLTARKYKIEARPPYFVPAFFLFGTFGAFTRMQWPITNRRELLFIFSLGPICGFFISWIVLFIGLSMSTVVATSIVEEQHIIFNHSIITFLTTKLIFGSIANTKEIQLHPIALAGWLGFYYNLWHLFPIGKLDGGRIIYGLWGYKITKWVSYVTILILILFSFYWTGWLNMVFFGVICMIHLRRQYPADIYNGELDKLHKLIPLVLLLIFILSFAPIPLVISK